MIAQAGDEKVPCFFEQKFEYGMIAAERIKELVEEKLQGTDCFLVDVQVRPGNRIAVFIDRDKGGIAINDCVEISRHLEKSLDRSVEDFELEVSSPGMSQPLKLLRQYRKHVGRKVTVLLRDGRRLEGRLDSADENGFMLEEEKKKKSAEAPQRHALAYDQVKETTLVISFN